MTAVIRFPREHTACAVQPIRGTVYDEAMKIALSAGADWPRMMAAAQTLSASPHWPHTRTARHIRTAYSLHREGLLNPVNPAHRDRREMVDRWKANALTAATEETRVQIAMRYRPELLQVGAGLVLAVLVAVTFNVWVV